MDFEEFKKVRKIFYMDHDTCSIKFAPGKFTNSTHAEWFSEYSIPYPHTILGYLIEGEDSHIMLYANDFAVPPMVTQLVPYLFTYFPSIQWIGLGLKQDKDGEIWEPKYKIYKA